MRLNNRAVPGQGASLEQKDISMRSWLIFATQQEVDFAAHVEQQTRLLRNKFRV